MMKYIPLFFLLFLFIACDTVEVEERVVYGSSGEPVKNAPVRQWTDTFIGKTKTDTNGRWTMTVPADVLINLCIFDPVQQFEACYTEGYLLTPTVQSKSHKMIHIEK